MGKYVVKEVFATLQGEGLRAGSKAVFVRFVACNLWDGLPEHRDRGAGPCARWCDTDFAKGTPTTGEDLVHQMTESWDALGGGSTRDQKWCVVSGGEPGLQLDVELVELLRVDGWSVAVETNGTVDSVALRMCDHVCVSPKRGTDWKRFFRHAHEVKVILPGAVEGEQGWTEAELLEVELHLGGFDHELGPALFVQPQDPILSPTGHPEATLLGSYRPGGVAAGAGRLPQLKGAFDANVARCIAFVVAHPNWRYSAQLHKYLNLA